ncbi:MAG: OmpH family outer membrane protein [Betaproteobacteria bacterium]|nr:OmpH family outer membrane protein [Betaproteobacteria bacterium]
MQVLIAAVLLLGVSCAAAQPVKVGVVNTARIESESVPAIRAIEALKKEFEPRNRQILELQKKIEAERQRFERERDKLPPAELKSRASAISAMTRQSDQMATGLAAELEARKAERAAGLIEEANAAIKTVAEAGKFDLILQQATYASPGIDITDRVLKELARRAGAKPSAK